MFDAAYKQEGDVGWIIFGDCVREYIGGKKAGDKIFGLTLNTEYIVSVSVRESIAPSNGPLCAWVIHIRCSDGGEYIVCPSFKERCGTSYGRPITRTRLGWESREAALEDMTGIVFHGKSGG